MNMKKVRESTKKRWCFTLNNPDGTEVIDKEQVTYYVIGKEVGESGTPHLQGYVEMKKPVRLSAMTSLLPRAHWEKAIGTPWQNYMYCTKDGVFHEYGTTPIKPRSETRKESKQEDDNVYAEAFECDTVREGLEVIKRKRPRDLALYGEAIERNLKRSKVVTTKSLYSLEDFTAPPLIFDKPILLWGDSGIGKTQYALAHFINPLLVSHMDQLKSLSPDHDGIIFDDMSFKHWPPESVIHLLDTEVERAINVRYGTVSIPPNTIKVFTHNTNNPFYLESTPSQQQSAIERRYRSVHAIVLRQHKKTWDDILNEMDTEPE